jgi:hypothetical protein
MIDPPKSDYFSANMMNCLGCTMVASEKNIRYKQFFSKEHPSINHWGAMI